jgi:hypothetical protein
MRHSNKTASFGISRAALGCALGVCMVLAVVPARAADDDDDAKAPLDTQIMRKIMSGLGFQRDGDYNGINYQERAPLVIPPGLSSLPPPEKPGAAVVNNPSWPVDPDLKRKKEAAAAERKSRVNADEQLQREQRALRPDEMTPGPKPRDMPAPSAAGSASVSPNGYGSQLSPSELGYRGSIWDKMFGDNGGEVGQFTGEQARTSLTAPPPGYQTPSPDQPYGVSKAKPVAQTSGDYLLNHPVGTQ